MKGRRMARYMLIFVQILVLFIIFYSIIFSITYIYPPRLSTDYETSFSIQDYYSQEAGVDRAISIDNYRDRFNVTLQIINEAESVLDLSYFFINDGETTEQIIGALLEAADRGVKIRIIIDGLLFGFSDESGYALANHENISIVIYNPMNPLKPSELNSRMHDKYIICDNKLLLMGGGNLGDAYFSSNGHKGKRTMDRLILVYNTEFDSDSEESVLYNIRSYMNTMWDSTYVEAGFNDHAFDDCVDDSYRDSYTKLKAEHGNEFIMEDYNYYDATLPTNKISFFYNPINTGSKEPTGEYIMTSLMSSAKDNVLIETPYLIADDNIYGLLNELYKNDVECNVITSSPAAVSTADLVLYAVYSGDRKNLLSTGINLYEHQSDEYKHIKAYVIDNRLSLVGSYNLCHRSYITNTEVMLAIDSTEFADHMMLASNDYIAHSCPVGDDDRYIEHNVDALETPFMKNLLINIVKYSFQPLRKMM